MDTSGADKLQNLSPYYSLMLLSQALARLLRMAGSATSSTLCDYRLRIRATNVLRSITDFTLRTANGNSSWGTTPSREETAYAVITLSKVLSAATSPKIEHELRAKIAAARLFLLDQQEAQLEYLWVEKVTFGSKLLSEAYVLAALNLTSSEGSSVDNSRHIPVLDGKIQEIDPELNVTAMNGHPKSRDNGAHVRVDSVMDADEGSSSSGHISTPESEALDGWTEKNEQILLAPYRYLDQNPGKDIRGAFITAFNSWLQVPPERLRIIERVVRMLHTSSLLVDDIEDNSDLRRGIPVAHHVFGIPQTFNSANYVYFQALREVRDLHNVEALDVFVEELVNLHRGQGLDLFYRDSLTCPTEEEYLQMVGNKTGGLFRLATRLMQSESHTGRDLTPLVSVLGLMFQVCDDYLNLKSTTYTKTKGLCEDLTEGKFSFPIIHSIRADPTNHELLAILKQKPHEAEIKSYAVSCMERTGSFEYTRQTAARLKSEVIEMISAHEAQGWGDATAIRKLIDRMDLA